MLQEFLKPVVNIIFDENFPYKQEFVLKLQKTKLFSLKTIDEDYFLNISKVLLEDGDPYDYMQIHMPKTEGDEFIEMFVSETLKKEHSNSFLYDKETTDNEFQNRAAEFFQKYRNTHYRVIEENSGFSFFKKYLEVDPLKKKRYADALLYFKEYNRAISEYKSIYTDFPKYCNRRIGFVKALLLTSEKTDSKIIIELYIWDVVLYLQQNYLLYFISKSLPTDQRQGVEYWLSKQNLNGKRMILNYINFKNFIDLKQSERVNRYFNLLKDEIETNFDKATVYERKMVWKDLMIRIEGELILFTSSF